jgi:lipopolysaccharide biosynthesis glycosyltransferase
VLTPSLKTLAEIKKMINTSHLIAGYKFPDQDLLADKFHGRLLVLPWFVNALKTLRAVHPQLWRDDKAALVHYMLVVWYK